MPDTIINPGQFTMAGDVDARGATLGYAPKKYRVPDALDAAIDEALGIGQFDRIGAAIDEAVKLPAQPTQAPKDYPGGSARAYDPMEESAWTRFSSGFQKSLTGPLAAPFGQVGSDYAQSVKALPEPAGVAGFAGETLGSVAKMAPAMLAGPAALVPVAVGDASRQAMQSIDQGSSAPAALAKGIGTGAMEMAQFKALSAPAKTIMGTVAKQFGIGAGYAVAGSAYDNAVDVVDGKKSYEQASKEFTESLPENVIKGGATQLLMHGFNSLIQHAMEYRRATGDTTPFAKRSTVRPEDFADFVKPNILPEPPRTESGQIIVQGRPSDVTVDQPVAGLMQRLKARPALPSADPSSPPPSGPVQQTTPSPDPQKPSPASAESPKPVGLMERLKGNTAQTSAVASQTVPSPQSITERAQELLDSGDAATMEEALQIAEADAKADARNAQPATPKVAAPKPTKTREVLDKKKAPATKNPPGVRRISQAQVEKHLDAIIEERGYSAIDSANSEYEAMRMKHESEGTLNPVGGESDHLQVHPDMVSHLNALDRQKLAGKIDINPNGVTDTDHIPSVERAIEEAVAGQKGVRANLAKDVLENPSQYDPETLLNAFLYTKRQELQDEITRTRPKTSQSAKAKAARMMDGAKKPSEKNSALRALLDEKNAPKQFVNPKELPVGTTVTIYGEEFDVAIGKDGEKVIADGVIIPVEGIEKLPIDVGSITKTDPDKTVDDIDLEEDEIGTKSVIRPRPKFKDGFVLDDGLGQPIESDDYGLPPELQGDGEDINEPGAFEEDDAPTGVTKDLLGNPVVDAATGQQQGLAFPEESQLSKDTKAAARPDIKGQQKLRPATPGRGRNQYPGARGGFVDLSGVTDMIATVAKGTRAAVNVFTGEMVEAIRNTTAGRIVGRYLDDASSKAATLIGKFANDAHDAYKGLTRDDRKWMDTVQPGQLYSNRQRMVDNTRTAYLTAPNQRLQKWVDAHKKMMDVTGDAAISVGVMREDGSPFQKSTGPRAIREFTPDAWEAVHYGSGPLFEAIANTIAAENGTSVQQAKDILKEQFSPSSVRHVGALENYRKIEFLPDHVMLNGKLVPILENDPYLSIMNAGKRQAQRIYFVEKFGQETKATPITKLDRLRARHAQEGGSARAFDDVIRVWNGRPYGRIPGDPRAGWKRAGKILDTLISGEQTSNSVIPNIPQVLVQVPRLAGFRNLAKGAKQVIMHPKASASILAEMGAVNRSVMEWTTRAGHRPEDVARIMHDLATRGLGSHWLNQFNSMAAGMAGKEKAKQWRMKGLSESDVRVAQELRLTKAEIADAKKGIISKDTENKIVQNMVKVTQYTTEDAHRRSLVQNVPILNFVAAYNSYFVGTTKSILRAMDDARSAIASADPVKMGGAGERLLKLLIGMLGAGAAAMLMRRWIKGQEIKKKDESYWDLAGSALWEVGVMGSAQRFVDAFHWSNASSVEKFAMATAPKVSYIFDLLNALFTTQKYQKYGMWEAFKDMQRRNTPALNSILGGVDRAKSPAYGQYIKTRTRVSDWLKDNDLDKPMMVDAPANPAYIKAARHVGMGDIESAAGEIADEIRGLDGAEWKKALQGFQRSMDDKSPLGRLTKGQTAQYLDSLPEAEQDRLIQQQRDWLESYKQAIQKAIDDTDSQRSKDAA